MIHHILRDRFGSGLILFMIRKYPRFMKEPGIISIRSIVFFSRHLTCSCIFSGIISEGIYRPGMPGFISPKKHICPYNQKR